jgi:hypothetical protein
MQVEKRRIVLAMGQRIENAAGEIIIGRAMHRARRHRFGRDWRDDRGTFLLGDIQKGRERMIGALVGGHHRLALMQAPVAEALQIGRDRREGIGLVLHHRDEEAHVSLHERFDASVAARGVVGKPQLFKTTQAPPLLCSRLQISIAASRVAAGMRTR